MATQKRITITVTATLEMPSVSDPDAIAGKSIDIDLEDAVVEGFKATIGATGDSRVGRRRAQTDTPNELEVMVRAKKVTIREVVAPAPVDPPADPDPADGGV
jgi:hypothetical protein